MELKQDLVRVCLASQLRFNRTFMELKQGSWLEREEEKLDVLIGPSWN